MPCFLVHLQSEADSQTGFEFINQPESICIRMGMEGFFGQMVPERGRRNTAARTPRQHNYYIFNTRNGKSEKKK